MSRIKERVARLEGALTGNGRLIVLLCGEGADANAALTERHVIPRPSDMLVVVHKPRPCIAAITIDGVAALM